MSQVRQTLTLFKRDFHFLWSCPGTWNDLDAWQLRRIVALQQFGLSKLRFMALCVPILLKVKKSLVKQWVIGRTLNAEYLELARFLTDEKQLLTRNLIGSYRGFKTVSKWQEMVAKQYFVAEGYLAKYRETHDASWLNYFLCAFYIAPNKEFASIDEDKDYKLFINWPMDVKLSVLAFYVGARQEFQNSPNFSRAFKKGGSGRVNVIESLMKMRSNMAGNTLTQTKLIDATPLPELFFQLNKDIEDAEQRAQQLRSRGK